MGCKSIVTKSRKGLSLVELMIVLIIVAIVTFGFGTSAIKQVKKSNRSTVVNELQVLASNFSDAYYDLGNPEYDPETPEGLTGFKAFLNVLSSEYLAYSFDMDSLEATTNGFHIKVKDPVDVWEQPYECWFVTKGNNRYALVASGGDDGTIRFEGYKNNKYDDDIVLIVKPKISS